MEREQEIAAILDDARKQRRAPSRGLWIAALIVGAVCAIGFAIAMLVEPAPASTTTHPVHDGTGFVRGLAIGIAIGIAAGLVIARQVAAHSSRNRP